MEIQLYNTLFKQKEIFKSIDTNRIRMYSCGPTVYDYAQIGNLRAYVFTDTLRRTLEWNSYQVTHVMNVTDIGHLVGDGDDGEDKMTKALKRENKPLTLGAMKELAIFYENAFIEDLKSLNIKLANIMPRASENIEADIEIIKILEKKGVTYKISDGIYFDTAKFPNYGRLGGFNSVDLKDGARVSINTEKKDPKDFCLWKFSRDKTGFSSPFGQGFPGWHIECSAMSKKYLGQPFDIHTGGIDHVGTHHNNEIAQSECAFDVQLANYWLHNEHLKVDGEKMSKSKNNFLKLSNLLEQSVSPLSYRYWLLTSHYRSPVNFTYEAVNGAQNALIRLIKTIGRYKNGGNIIEEYKNRFTSFINDDLNLPQALALVWTLISDQNQNEADKKATIIDFDRVLGLKLDSIPDFEPKDYPPEIQALMEARQQARDQKDWIKADALRNEIIDRGYSVEDK